MTSVGMDNCKVVEWDSHEASWPHLPPVGGLGYTATLVGHYIWTVGGSITQNAIYILDTNSKNWEVLSLSKDGIRPWRLGAVSVNLFEDKFYLLGMEISGVGFDGKRSNEVYGLDLLLQELQEVRTFGGAARPRFTRSHMANVCETLGLLVFFGGLGNASNTLWILDFNSSQWTKPKTNGAAPYQSGRLASCMAGCYLCVYGLDTSLFPRDFYMIDISERRNLTWHRLDVQSPVGRLVSGSKMVYAGSGRVLIFGHTVNVMVDGTFVLENLFKPDREFYMVKHRKDTTSETRLRYASKTKRPGGRTLPLVALAHSKMYILGGSVNRSEYFELQASS